MKLVSVETPEKSVCKMTFSATAEELEAASNAVYERTRATYTIKGFQKGEADRAQIEADRGEHTFWYLSLIHIYCRTSKSWMQNLRPFPRRKTVSTPVTRKRCV